MTTKTQDFHFFASSPFTWATTTDKRELPDLLDIFQKEGYEYSLFKVPGVWDSQYQIEFYAPKVEGVELLGKFKPRKKA
jgi:hypothetical protein